MPSLKSTIKRSSAAAYQRKVREMESAGVKLDSDEINQPWAKYETEMAQYVRTNLTEAQ